MSDETTARVKKTGYRGKKAKRMYGERVKRSPTDFPKLVRKPKEWRTIGDTVQVHVTIPRWKDVIVFGMTKEGERVARMDSRPDEPLAIPGQYGRYEGGHYIPGVGEVCVIRFGDRGVAYLADDGRSFTWTEDK